MHNVRTPIGKRTAWRNTEELNSFLLHAMPSSMTQKLTFVAVSLIVFQAMIEWRSGANVCIVEKFSNFPTIFLNLAEVTGLCVTFNAGDLNI